jgi:putative transposase
MRRAQLHEISTQIVREFGVICVEDLDIQGMLTPGDGPKTAQDWGLRRNIHHASWGTFIDMLTYKAEWAGRQFVKVDPRGTSQECSGCGAEVQKDLSVRKHRCPTCELVLDRDHNAALNVLQRGLAVPACKLGTGLPSGGRTHRESPPGTLNREAGTDVA